jgi:hypothetical protein
MIYFKIEMSQNLTPLLQVLKVSILERRRSVTREWPRVPTRRPSRGAKQKDRVLCGLTTPLPLFVERCRKEEKLQMLKIQ